jgi:2-dehydropantoate 2-reductase
MIEASVLIVGAGAIGGVTAAKMDGGVRRVSVLDANEEHVEKMRDPGLLLDDLGEERRVSLDAHSGPADLEDPFDFALVTLKAPHLESALGPLVECGLAKAFVSLGNGLVQDHIASIVGEENLIVGTVEWGATNLGAGYLARTTRAPFVVGEPDGETKDRTRLLADVLATVSDVRITENIGGQVWSKLLVNSTFSGLGAVSGLLYREVVADPAGKEAALAVWREGYDVGMAQGITLDKVLGVPAESLVERGPEARQKVDEALRVAMGYAGATKASMLQDRGRRDQRRRRRAGKGVRRRNSLQRAGGRARARHGTRRAATGPWRVRGTADPSRLACLSRDDAVGDLGQVRPNHVWLLDERVEGLPRDESRGATRPQGSRHVPGVRRDEA